MNWRDWADRWQEGRIGFHLSEPNPSLLRYLARLVDGPARVYVPLCGKSVDLIYLADHGHQVVGVEFVQQAVEEFFAEQGLEPTREHAAHLVYRAGPLELHVADALTVSEASLGRIDALYDRAALIALAPEQREAYAEAALALVPSGGRMLLVTLSYDQGRMEGPPFSVPEEEVRRLYGAGFSLEVLEESREEAPPRFAELGLEVLSTTWLLSRR
jgi:thiopurine S-methyltransferase